MKAVIQRVSSGEVVSDGVLTGKISAGLVILLGVRKGDTRSDASLLAAKISKLRIFDDGNGKMNLSVNDINGSALVISNFTLYANYSHGNRPDYLDAEEPEKANVMYEFFNDELRRNGVPTQTGVFGAYMEPTIRADGPITIVIESEKLKK